MFWSIFVQLCNEKGVKPSKACEMMGFSNSTATHWKRHNSWPRGDTLKKVADFFGCSVDDLFAIKGGQVKRSINNVSSNGNCAHDMAYSLIKYCVGREDADLMFQAAGIPVEDHQYQMPPNVLRWMAARCGLETERFLSSEPVSIDDLERQWDPQKLNELMLDSEIEEMDNRYLKAKCQKYAAIAKSKCWDFA